MKGILNNEFSVNIGIIATSDTFITNREYKEFIRKNFNADCVEMERVAVANVCKECNVPFVVIRGISDKLNDKNPSDTYEKYKIIASRRGAMFLKELVKYNI